ncbi:alpha/beta fold hydrolase [Falsiroseomonas stagni]|uniref:Pimeloyl-ACP methyl ester carboxylesterase n=1 Tax=Falsiroseomonas stagni DSM 19981 TaxID=1123062 RepID=A0A1I4AWV2_9PROT|nr:alpha/beta hydrolase [Falsiroseomonas stagni]SFK60096.1 Pimeloyl-ACP methyl ester carboxylesterase [Falsiroseomonas stagni DSM 19981]
MSALLPTGPIVTRDGVALFTRAAGAGPPVVLLASWSLSSLSWGPVMARLAAQGFRALAHDRRGHGRSADPGGGMDYDTLAEDLADVLAAHDLHAVTLVAMSGAAGEAVRYLTRHGASRIARLVLIGPTTPLLVQRPDNPLGIPAEALAALRATLLDDFPRWLAENARPFGGPDASDARLDALRADALTASLPALLAFHQSLAEIDFRAELATLGLPLLVIQGAADATCPLDLTGRPTTALVRGAGLLVVPGGTLGLVASHPALVAAEIAAFARGEG